MNDAKKAYLATYLVLTTILSFLFCFISKPEGGGDVGFWTRLFASLAAIPVGFIGAMIGDFIRRLTIPDAIFTTGGMFSILKTRIFWFCVPQLVGMFIGIALVAGQILPKRVERVYAPSRSQVEDLTRVASSSQNPDLSRLEDIRVEPFSSDPKDRAAQADVEKRIVEFLKTGEDADMRAMRAALPTREGERIRDEALTVALDNLPEVAGGSVQFLRSANGGGVISNVSRTEKIVSLFSLNPDRGSTCEVVGPARKAVDQRVITLKQDDCSLTLIRKNERFVVSGPCASACGMGATLEDEYILSAETFVENAGTDSKGYPIYMVTSGIRTGLAD